ncbi:MULTISPECIES: hypothetical protein [Shewanella]|uniref:hypothetical protein n=1 Tax=Shewanella TaxID=22 RepID=UPI001F25E56B|nr:MULTISPECIES: hypothetical protein [Shewanella]
MFELSPNDASMKLYSSLLAALKTGQIIRLYSLHFVGANVLNPVVVPLLPIVGLLTANLNTLIRGEQKLSIPIGLKTLTAAACAFACVWFALLITAIYGGGESDSFAGIEVLMFFALGFLLYRFVDLSRLLGASAQVWLYRLSLPLIVMACLGVINWG